eukprot:4235636-Amphidinium_carterae.1
MAVISAGELDDKGVFSNLKTPEACLYTEELKVPLTRRNKKHVAPVEVLRLCGALGSGSTEAGPTAQLGDSALAPIAPLGAEEPGRASTDPPPEMVDPTQ